MSIQFVWLAILMGLATYPWRAVPLLLPGVERLPRLAKDYLGLIGPAMLATLAAVSVMVTTDAARRSSLHVGPEWIAVVIAVTVVALGRSLLVGLVLAAVFVAVLRALGFAAIP